MNSQGTILVGILGDVAVIRVDGKGSVANSPALRQFTKEMVRRGLKNFAVDLSCCTMMDSTFMGTLAGTALSLRDAGGGRVRILGANERNQSLLRGLGLDHILEIETGPSPDLKSLPATPCCGAAAAANEAETARTSLEAHEALVRASPENLAKFKDVLDFIRQDLADSPK